MRKVFSAWFLSVWYGAYFVRKPESPQKRRQMGTKRSAKTESFYNSKRAAKTAFLFCPLAITQIPPPLIIEVKGILYCISYIHTFILIKTPCFFCCKISYNKTPHGQAEQVSVALLLLPHGQAEQVSGALLLLPHGQ